jgi:hypothetical protein
MSESINAAGNEQCRQDFERGAFSQKSWIVAQFQSISPVKRIFYGQFLRFSQMGVGDSRTPTLWRRT